MNDKLILFRVNNPQPDNKNHSFTAFLAPFTNEWSLYNSLYNEDYQNDTQLFPSPDTSRILKTSYQSDGSPVIELINMQTNEVIWYQPDFINFSIIDGYPFDQIDWMTDSSKVAISNEVGMREFITILDRNGNTLDDIENSSGNILSWSSNGKYLAFGQTKSVEEVPK